LPIAERGAVLVQQPLDLVVGILALPGEVALVRDRTGSTVFILCPDAGEEDHLARSGDRHRLGEASFGPFGIGVVLLFERRRSLRKRFTEGAISLRSSSHFALMAYSKAEKPVALPPGRLRLSTRPAPTGSAICTNTIGNVRVGSGGEQTFIF
jgi:hypothetical protein